MPVRVAGACGHFSLDDLQWSRARSSQWSRVLEGAPAFPEAEAALRFYASGDIDGIEYRTAHNRHRDELPSLVRARMNPIIQREGALCVPKSVGWFVADV